MRMKSGSSRQGKGRHQPRGTGCFLDGAGDEHNPAGPLKPPPARSLQPAVPSSAFVRDRRLGACVASATHPHCSPTTPAPFKAGNSPSGGVPSCGRTCWRQSWNSRPGRRLSRRPPTCEIARGLKLQNRVGQNDRRVFKDGACGRAFALSSPRGNRPERANPLLTRAGGATSFRLVPVRTGRRRRRHSGRWQRGREASGLQPGAKGPGPTHVRRKHRGSGSARRPRPYSGPGSPQSAGAAAPDEARPGDPAGLRALRSDPAGRADAGNANGPGGRRRSLTCHSRDTWARGAQAVPARLSRPCPLRGCTTSNTPGQRPFVRKEEAKTPRGGTCRRPRATNMSPTRQGAARARLSWSPHPGARRVACARCRHTRTKSGASERASVAPARAASSASPTASPTSPAPVPTHQLGTLFPSRRVSGEALSRARTAWLI